MPISRSATACTGWVVPSGSPPVLTQEFPPQRALVFNTRPHGHQEKGEEEGKITQDITESRLEAEYGHLNPTS